MGKQDTMRAGAVLFFAFVAGVTSCKPNELQWTCDFDAMVARPLADQDATPNEAGALPANVCGDTCGPPAQFCTFTLLDGGTPGAVCPLCTF
jgi:hypothetical protein